jgi:hypothetical protein
MNIFKKLKRWIFRKKTSGNQAPSYVSTGHKTPRRAKLEERSRSLVLWMGTPFSPIVVNFKDPIHQHYKR